MQKKIYCTAILFLFLLGSRNQVFSQNVFALQGLRFNTLVAGKTTAFRFYPNPTALTGMGKLETTILRPDGTQLVHSWSRSELVDIPSGSLGGSLTLRIKGGSAALIDHPTPIFADQEVPKKFDHAKPE